MKKAKSTIFSNWEGFDPEKKAQEFGYDTLNALFQADVMQPYVIIERMPQLPNMVWDTLFYLSI
jgi:hypothetical protein